MFDWATTNTASNAEPSQGLTLDKILQAKRRIDALGPPPPQVRIVESLSAVKNCRPARLFPKRKSKSLRHLNRMRRKWIKRYGMTSDPAIYKMPAPGFVYFVVHPALMPQLRAAIKASESR